MGLILPYLGLVTSLLCANNFDQDTVIEPYYFLPFHMYEFWGNAYFSLVEGYVLLVADRDSLVLQNMEPRVAIRLGALAERRRREFGRGGGALYAESANL